MDTQMTSKQEMDTMSGSLPDFSIVLVCWNNKVYLEPCLRSLYDEGLKRSFDVVVVDNGSTDGSQDMLREKHPDIMIIQNDHNVGLAKACNQGIEATASPFVLLLNNDTLVNAEALDALVDFMADTPDAGAVGGKLLNKDCSFQAGYAEFSSLWEEFMIATHIGESLREGYPSHLDVEMQQPTPVGWLSSACLLLRRTALDEVGMLDEEYFIYGDEADLQYRLQQHGWKVYYLPTATTLHYGGGSMNRWRRRKMVYRGKMLFYKKNYGPVKEGALRVMLGGLSLVKLAGWGGAYLLPSKRDVASKELRSNIEVMKLCLRLE
jgi:GT2 family glycosyltransferase